MFLSRHKPEKIVFGTWEYREDTVWVHLIKLNWPIYKWKMYFLLIQDCSNVCRDIKKHLESFEYKLIKMEVEKVILMLKAAVVINN